MANQKYISLILAEKIVQLLDESGATEVQKVAAIEAARAIIPTTAGSAHANAVEREERPPFPER